MKIVVCLKQVPDMESTQIIDGKRDESQVALKSTISITTPLKQPFS